VETTGAVQGATGTFTGNINSSGGALQTNGVTRIDNSGVGSFGTGTTINSQTAWHAGNDGAASGLDADTLDTHDTSYFQREITGSCDAGSSIRVVNDDGTVTCETDDTGGATCPSGFTDTTYGYCVQDNEANSGSGLNWYAASDYCADNHTARLCTSSEWYNACVNGKLTNGTDDWEWVDSWSHSYRAIIRGSGSCTAVYSYLDYDGGNAASGTYAFRCCKSKY